MSLVEGLRESDLEGLVIPVISIDQYESKIDDDAIVIAFYVEYKDPAIDLNRFVQKSAADILDTEVSPAPTEDGYYVVFVEVMRNEEFPHVLAAILENLSNLVNSNSWRFTCYGHESVYDLTDENILSYVRLKPKDEDVQKEALNDFFNQSSLDDLIVEGRCITFSRKSLSESYEIVDFGDYDYLETRHHLSPYVYNNTANSHERQRVEALLGSGWLVESAESKLFLHNVYDERILILKPMIHRLGKFNATITPNK